MMGDFAVFPPDVRHIEVYRNYALCIAWQPILHKFCDFVAADRILGHPTMGHLYKNRTRSIFGKLSNRPLHRIDDGVLAVVGALHFAFGIGAHLDAIW